jgi:hypothetical protein
MDLSKRGLFAVAFTVVLLASMLVGVQFVREAKGAVEFSQTTPNTDPPALIINSPIKNAITDSTVPFNFTITKPTSWDTSGNPNNYYSATISYVYCIFDGTTHQVFQAEDTYPLPQDRLASVSNFSVTFNGLADGVHNMYVVVYSQSVYQTSPDPRVISYIPEEPNYHLYNMTVTKVVHFTVEGKANSSANPSNATILTVDITPPTPTPPPTAQRTPTLLILSPLNKTYTTSTIPFTYSINSKSSIAVCMLDGESFCPIIESETKQFSGNATLPDLPDGSHKLEIAIQSNPVGYNRTVIYFNVDTSSPEVNSPQINSGFVFLFAIVIFLVFLVLAIALHRRKNAKLTIKAANMSKQQTA